MPGAGHSELHSATREVVEAAFRLPTPHLNCPEDPERVLVTVADGGYDADTVASMAGNLAGAYLGEEAFPERWLEELEFLEYLRELADDLLEVAGFEWV